MNRFSYILPIVASVILHTVLLVVITYGWGLGSAKEKTQMPRFVEAKLVQLKATAAKKKHPKARINKIDLTKKREQQERQRKAEAEKKRKQQALAAQKEKNRKEKELAELERKREFEEELKREQEAERQRRQMEEEFASELADEEALLEEEEYESEAQSYTALIAARIEQNWSRPPSARKGMQCELVLQLVPTGQVVDVSVKKSSGNSAFDRSAMQAVKKVERFAQLQNMSPELFERHFRRLRLVFNPKDLRQ